MTKDKRFTIKIMGEVFESDEDGFLNLNDIKNKLNLPESKKPSRWDNAFSRSFKENNQMTLKEIKNSEFSYSKYYAGDEYVVVEYAKWCSLPIESHGVSVFIKRDETFIGNLLKQIFPDIEFQKPYLDGKYFVDYYIPSLELNIEYDEKYHFTKTKRLEDAKRELDIGGRFFRINQGKELDGILKLKNLFGKNIRKSSMVWVVNKKYYFKEEMTAYKFCVSMGTTNISKVKLPKNTVENKFIVTGDYPMVYFPLVVVDIDSNDPFNEPMPF